MTQSTEVEQSRRLSRRTVVKGGLVAGGALWVAPIVTGFGIANADATSGKTPPPPGGTVAPSWVMLVVSYGSAFYGIKIDKDGNVSCMDAPNNGGGVGVTTWTTYITGKWTLDETSCSTATVALTSDTPAKGIKFSLTAGTVVGYLLHDGNPSTGLYTPSDILPSNLHVSAPLGTAGPFSFTKDA